MKPPILILGAGFAGHIPRLSIVDDLPNTTVLTSEC